MENDRVQTGALLYQYGVGVIAGIGGLTSGAWVAWPSSAIKPLLNGEESFNVTRSEVSTMVSLMDFGNILSPIPVSYCMDMFGRKSTLYSVAIMNLIASLVVLTASNIWYLYVARLAAGLAKGVIFAVVPIYFGEIANPQIRGGLSTMFVGFLNIGLFYDYLLGAFLSYDSLNIANAIPALIFALTFFKVPESPYYLTMKLKERKAIKSLAKYRQVKRDNQALLEEANLVSVTVKTDLEHTGRFIDLFTTRSMRRATLIIALLSIFQRSVGLSPALAYSTITLPERGGGFSREIYMIIFSFILVTANYAATPLIDSWGRKKLLILSSTLCALVQGIAGLFYYCQSHSFDVTSWQWVPYACLVSVGFTFSIGIGVIPSTFVGELFPTNLKCFASSVSAIMLAATSFVMNRIFREVADRWGVEYMYLYFSTSLIVCTVFTYVFVFETKGKSFAEIQHILKVTTGEFVPEKIKTQEYIITEKNCINKI